MCAPWAHQANSTFLATARFARFGTMTSVARGQGSQNFGQNISAQRFFSTAASKSESDTEVDSDASDDEASQQSGSRYQQFNNYDRNNSMMQQDIDLLQVGEKI